jgi:hypothetical protein
MAASAATESGVMAKLAKAGSGKRRMAAKWRLISGSVINKRWRFRLSGWRGESQLSISG